MAIYELKAELEYGGKTHIFTDDYYAIFALDALDLAVEFLIGKMYKLDEEYGKWFHFDAGKEDHGKSIEIYVSDSWQNAENSVKVGTCTLYKIEENDGN